jgi:hypothetical protein
MEFSTDDTEVVEILFSRGLVKVLFATETFAMVRLLLIYIRSADYSGCEHACEECRICGY